MHQERRSYVFLEHVGPPHVAAQRVEAAVPLWSGHAQQRGTGLRGGGQKASASIAMSTCVGLPRGGSEAWREWTLR